jgi:LPS-assembly lipoprotein
MYGGGQTGPQAAVKAAYNDIFIDNIPDREGQMLRNHLIDRLYTSGRPVYPSYTLAVGKINESLSDLDITKSSDATRSQLRLSTSMALKDNATGQALLKRDLTAITSYNVLQSQFTTRVSEQNARENAITDLARQIELQLGLYFNREAPATPMLQQTPPPAARPRSLNP